MNGGPSQLWRVTESIVNLDHFPEITKAIAYCGNLSPERRAELDQ